jgi:predicted AAA+ superfamily ATPase
VLPAPQDVRAALAAALPPAPVLHVFHGALQAPPARALRRLGQACAGGEVRAAAEAYVRLFRSLVDEGWAGDAWRAHLATAVAQDGNAFTLGPDPGSGLTAAARTDLEALERWADSAPLERVRQVLAAAGYALAPCRDLGPRVPQGVAARLAHGGGWPALAEDLRAQALAGGAGPFAAHLAYRWQPARSGRGRLVPIRRPDLPAEEELYGYTEERALVRENTERFLRGLPAQDVLLYGDRGTGKSTTVKALLRRYGPRGLRLIELHRGDLTDLPYIWEAVDGAPQRFIVFVDDLSFDAGETTYKDAKAALQGGLAGRPANVLVYATSNRRHLVEERLPAREAGDDPRPKEAVEERLSLADRFGLTVIFPAPDQELYLGIVAHLAALRGLEVAGAELRARALRWAQWQNGRSGRTARQFVEALQAELAEGAG